MGISDFTDKMEKALSNYYCESAEVRIHKVYKNNGLLLYGVCVLEKGKNIAPTIYLNQFYEEYEEGASFGEIVRRVIEITEENQVSKSLDIDFFLDYEKVKKRLVLRLIHKEGNRHLLTEVPYQEFMDLALVCHCVLESEEIGSGAILIHRHHMEAWNIKEETLFKDAFENSPRIEPYQIRKMGDMIKELLLDTIVKEVNDMCSDNEEEAELLIKCMKGRMERRVEEAQLPMHVLTNKNRYYGAACIAYPNVLEEVGEMLQDDYYVIPSSVHEILFISAKDCIESEKLNQMIEDVNWYHVKDEDWLSNHTYLYLREERRLLSITDQ